MSEDEGDLLLGAEIGEPVTGEDALDADDDLVGVGRDGVEESVRIGVDVPVELDLAVVVDDAELHGTGVQVDAAVVGVAVGEESHWASSFGKMVGAIPVYCVVGLEGASMSIRPLELSVLRCHGPCRARPAPSPARSSALGRSLAEKNALITIKGLK